MGINVRAEERDSGIWLTSKSDFSFSHLLPCNPKAIGIPSYVFSILCLYHLILCQLWKGSLLQTMKEQQDVLYPKKGLWRIFVLDVSSRRNPIVNWTKVKASKVRKLGLSSLEDGRPQETRCLGSYVIIHSISHLHLGTPVLPLPSGCPV